MILSSVYSTVLAAAWAGSVPPALVESVALSKVRAGDWVTYRLDDGSGTERFWRLSVVGEEAEPKGPSAVWLQLELGDHPSMRAPLAVVVVLADRRHGLTASGVHRTLVAFAMERPRELDSGQLRRFWQRSLHSEATSGGSPGAPRALSTRVRAPSRTLCRKGWVDTSVVETRLSTTVIQRIWAAPTIPLLGLLKIEFPGSGHAIEAHDWGFGARPRFSVHPGFVPQPAAEIRMEAAR